MLLYVWKWRGGWVVVWWKNSKKLYKPNTVTNTSSAANKSVAKISEVKTSVDKPTNRVSKEQLRSPECFWKFNFPNLHPPAYFLHFICDAAIIRMRDSAARISACYYPLCCVNSVGTNKKKHSHQMKNNYYGSWNVFLRAFAFDKWNKGMRTIHRSRFTKLFLQV